MISWRPEGRLENEDGEEKDRRRAVGPDNAGMKTTLRGSYEQISGSVWRWGGWTHKSASADG